MDLKKYIEQYFDILVTNKGYEKQTAWLTNIVENIVYSKENIALVITLEWAETSFCFDIRYDLNGIRHSVRETGDFSAHNSETGAVIENVFDYTRDIYDSNSFQLEKERILHGRYGIGKYEKMFCENVVIYQKLLLYALDKIERMTHSDTGA